MHAAQLRSLIRLALILPGALALATNAHAAEGEFCAFIQKVLGSKSAQFEPFRGRSKSSTSFDGTLAPASEFRCLTVVRRKYGDKILPPAYNCMRTDKATFEAAATAYVQRVDEMKACLPGWTIAEAKKGDAAKRSESWTTKARGADSEVSVNLIDFGHLGPQAVITEVSVVDTSPAPTDADIPVMK